MTLAEVLLQRLARWRPDSDRQTLEVAHPETGWAVAVTAGQVETLGSRLWEVALRRLEPQAQAPDLKEWAGRITSRVTGLLEPLRLLEVDAERGIALLRSTTPGQWGEGRFYYEVLLQADGTTAVRRYQAPDADNPRRRQVAFALTHEALAKLVADLTA